MHLVHQFIVRRTNSKLDGDGQTRFSSVADSSFLDSVLADFGLPPVPPMGGGAMLKYLIENLPQILLLIGKLVALFSAVGV